MKGSSKHIQLAPETWFRDKKAGPETHSTCTGNQVPRYQARSQGMIWCWNPVIDVKDVSILTNDRRWWWRNATQWCYSWCSNKTNDFTYDVMLWSRPTKPQTMMLRYQSTMLNSDQLCYRRRWYFESDQWCHAWQWCFNPAQRCYGQW